MSVPDPYKVLQVDSEAEFEVIEAAYRRLARKYHPDVSPGEESQERMVRINQAWELLRDPTRRAAVDRARTRNAGTAPSSGTTAKDAAADARARATAGHPATPPGTTYDVDPGYRAPSTPRPAEAASTESPDVPPASGPFRPIPQYTSPNWTSGRSNVGGGFDPATMATSQAVASAGPPPGNPSGSVLNFGRYVGWSLGEIGRHDLEYIEWLDRTPIGRIYQVELDEILRTRGRRVTAGPAEDTSRGLFRRR
ncbi:MAG TPA: DnaJ domain-containing protein [Candidatus Limnocylindrales bacterium]